MQNKNMFQLADDTIVTKCFSKKIKFLILKKNSKKILGWLESRTMVYLQLLNTMGNMSFSLVHPIHKYL
jgi:hypothetical protein